MIAVQTHRGGPTVVAAVSGTLERDHQVDDLITGLAELSADGPVIVDLSGLVLLSAHVVDRLADGLRLRFAGEEVRVVSSRLTARVLLRRAGATRRVFASVLDAVDDAERGTLSGARNGGLRT